MPAPSLKTVSPAELAKLEHAFATDPGSETYKPLAEAYLSMGRFMEAMVVCKKGVKAHPERPDPRVLLARVYADQGKDKKALEELQGALAIAPNDKVALRMTGALQLKNGEPDAGRANLLKSYEQDPNDSDTLAALSQHNIQIAKPAPPPPPEPPPAPAPVAAAPVMVAAAPPSPAAGGAGAVATSPQVQLPVQEAPAPAPAPAPRVNGAHARTPAAAPAPVRRAPRHEVSGEYDAYDDEISHSRARPKSKASMMIFLVLAVGGTLAVGGYAILRNMQKEKTIAVNKLLREVDKELRHDSYDAYIRINEAMDKALEILPENVSAHGFAAYAWTIRWAEHGGGEQAQKNAERHLQAAEEGGDTSASLVAARALYDTYNGKPKEAREKLEAIIKEAEGRGVKASPQVYLALGLIAMNQGDLQRSKESLDNAQAGAAGDPRVYAALGNLYRRMGQDSQAELNFIYALRYEKGHPESMLGSALLEMDKDEPDYGKVSRILKTLIEQEPPPSPRQLATAHLARAYMVSRVANELPQYKAEFQKQITEQTGITPDKGKAQAEVQKAEQLGFNLDRSNPELKLIKAKRLLSERQYDQAVGEVREAIKQDPTRAQFYVELAKALMAKEGGEKEAADALKKAIETMGESPRLQVMLGEAYLRQGKNDEAVSVLQKAAEGKAKNPEARLLLGTALREKKQTDKAIEQLEKASQEFLGNEPKVAQAAGQLGRAYEDKSDKTKAEEAYQKALNADPNHPDPYYFYARLLSDDRKQAKKVTELAKKYLELEPKGRWASQAQALVR